jgi:quercetin 2,3-dioxygenase
MKQTDMKPRSIARIVAAIDAMEGDGMRIRRAFPTYALADLDPFLLLDHLGPIQFQPGEAKGFPDHPHRGFETVTYVLEGEMQHRDSHGNHGVLGPGSVQWMTAGSGLVHSEMPGESLSKNGGTLHGFQLWVNLPRKYKMTPPRYQEYPGAQIPVIESAGATVKVAAGESLGQKGIIETNIPISYLHVTLQSGASFDQAMPATANAFVYVISGVGASGTSLASFAEGSLVIFQKDGDSIHVSNPSERPLEFLLVAGEPIGEPVVRAGPFVMNTKQEILQAFEDYQNGLMGTI